MKKNNKWLLIAVILLMMLSSSACAAIDTIFEEQGQGPTDLPAELPTATHAPSATPELAERIQLDPCTLLTEGEVSAVLGGPVSVQPAQGTGGCGYMLQSEEPGAMTQLTISAAQGAEAKAFAMLGITIFAGFSGDPDLMAQVEAYNQTLSDRSLHAILQGMGSVFEDTGMEITRIEGVEESGLWLPYENEFYSQGSLMLARGEEYVSLTLIDGDLTSAVDQLTSLADLTFDRLPPAFYLLDEDGDGTFSFEYSSEETEDETQEPIEPAPMDVEQGWVWVTAPNAGQIFAIDPQTNEVSATITAGRFPSDISISDGFVWVVSTTEGSIWKINPASAEVEQTIQLDGQTTHLDAGGGSVWVSGGLGLRRIDIATGSRTDVVYNPCYDVAIGEAAVWVSQTQDQQLLKIDPQTNQVVETVRLEGEPTAIVYGHGMVWTILGDRNEWIGIDPVSMQQTMSMSHGAFMHALAVGPERLWYTHPRHVDYYDPATMGAGIFSAPHPPARLVFFAGSVWATSPNEGIITRYDPEDGSVRAEIKIEADPTGIAAGE